MDFSINQTVWIPLSGGTRLAATIWRPTTDAPVPAVLEYLPYRRGDGTALRDDSTYPAYAAAGIAGVRVDARGSGDSEGIFDDEYSPQELADAAEVIAWIAAQDWSNGAVGMMGISWGGFNGLQVAALRPPALKAVISIASTSNRYTDDIHYKGGCLISANVSWAGTMLNYMSRPPDPDVVGNRWVEIWQDRLNQQPVLLDTWLSHQARDAYWKHGSICEDWGAIQCPVWVIAGWADGYRNTPAAIAAHLDAPVKAMTGPWVHKYPHFAYPHPRADFLTLSMDWWHHWLSGTDRGIAAWPEYRAYRIEAAQPGPWRGEDDGTWLATEWPCDQQRRIVALGDGGALDAPATRSVSIATPQHCGTMAGEYFTLAPNADMPQDQRSDDGLSACWDMPVDTAFDLLGRAQLTARIAIDQLQGNLIARLVDVHPDGTSALITRGVLNLCHRNGHETPQAMEPGQPVDITLWLDECAYRVRAGHRLRLALSTAYWPLVLPSPAAVTATLMPGADLTLPQAPQGAETAVPVPADPNPLPEFPRLSEPASTRTVTHELSNGRVRYTLSEDTGTTEVPRTGIRMQETREEIWEIDPADPAGATGHLTLTARRARGAWDTSTRSTIAFTAHPDRYAVEATVTAWNGEDEINTKTWSFEVPRQHV